MENRYHGLNLMYKEDGWVVTQAKLRDDRLYVDYTAVNEKLNDEFSYYATLQTIRNRENKKIKSLFGRFDFLEKKQKKQDHTIKLFSTEYLKLKGYHINGNLFNSSTRFRIGAFKNGELTHIQCTAHNSNDLLEVKNFNELKKSIYNVHSHCKKCIQERKFERSNVISNTVARFANKNEHRKQYIKQFGDVFKWVYEIIHFEPIILNSDKFLNEFKTRALAVQNRDIAIKEISLIK